MPASFEHAVLISKEDKEDLLAWLRGDEQGSYAAESGLVMVQKHSDGSLTIITQPEPYQDPDMVDEPGPGAPEGHVITRIDRLIDKHRKKMGQP